ncbi:MAG TPA: hypothetical protein VFS70_03765 [Actinomycetota bacterium]|nr:hypothetical protein [Actinomycetota bacterium]
MRMRVIHLAPTAFGPDGLYGNGQRGGEGVDHRRTCRLKSVTVV